MKKLPYLFFLLLGCIQTDLEDPFPPTLRIDNSIASIDFRVNGSYPLTAIYTDDTGEPTDVSILWESSDESILSFDENTATVHAEGLVLININANGLVATEPIETLPSRGSLLISGFTPKLQSGNSTSFKFNFTDLQGATNNSITPLWSSSNESVATINQNGEVTGLSSGLTDISVSFEGINNAIKLEISNDPVMLDPTIRMIQFAQFLDASESFQFQSDYYNENGVVDESSVISWSSSDETIITVDNTGLATANSSGTATIEATFQNSSATISVEVEGSQITERTGSLMGTGYDIEGDFTLSPNENGDLILTVSNYTPDGPGPYFYLANQTGNVNNGISLGDATTAGEYIINVSEIDSSVDINSFNYLVVWCEPFGVRLGFGEFEN